MWVIATDGKDKQHEYGPLGGNVAEDLAARLAVDPRCFRRVEVTAREPYVDQQARQQNHPATAPPFA